MGSFVSLVLQELLLWLGTACKTSDWMLISLQVLAAFLKAIGFIIPLMDAMYANYYTKEVMVVLIREFQTPDEEMKKIVLKVVKQCVGTEGVERDFIRTDILPEFFRNFWVRRMALDRRNYRQLVETTVELANKVSVRMALLCITILTCARADKIQCQLVVFSLTYPKIVQVSPSSTCLSSETKPDSSLLLVKTETDVQELLDNWLVFGQAILGRLKKQSSTSYIDWSFISL